MNISKNDIKIIQEIEKIFTDWWEYKNERTFENNQNKAEGIIIEGLKTASNAYPMLNEIAGLHGWINHHPDLEGANGQSALAELEKNYVDQDIKGIKHYRKFLIRELVEQENRWPSIIHYYALAREIHRWINILKQESSEVPWSDDAEGYIPNSDAVKLSDRISTLPKLSKILRPDGPIRYMRKGRRGKVNVSDFLEYMKFHSQGHIPDERIEEYLEGVETRKKAILSKKQAGK